ncbi:MAG: hypothetical protein CME70_15900 [Halobacteriovorax sp.]|nr:hypothetical protein [Halobacteriovorax sp.]|tara:strand:+ start:48410 stop:49144 length:735 start_codon:yes stop_codon:yes gene_type:complete
MKQELESNLKLDNSVFRNKIRSEKIPKYYFGPLHVLFNAALLFGSIIFHAKSLQAPELIHFTPFIIIIFLGNLAVFFIHKYPLHGRFKWNSYAYANHTKTHHVFYTEENVTWKDTRDWYTMFFPPEIVFAFIVLYHPIFYYLLKPVIGSNTTHTFLMASSCYFILYEIIHFTSHLPSKHPLLKIPFLRMMRRHHQIHHSPRLMGHYNFCIVFPLVDHLLGTFVDDNRYKVLTGKDAPGNGDTPN